MFASEPIIEKRLQALEKHLKQENPVLLSVVSSFRQIDRIAYRMGLLNQEQSYATMIPWWPLISILGTFSAGKSTFINNYLGTTLQSSGNQAVDDKFTVICQSSDGKVHTLPGLSLDADPRFPFYQVSDEIEKVAEGEGRRIDAYLQLKACPSEKLSGKILIDSPGFDADAQRTSTLQITEHIINLSDLVLVFFDARHPEPGAMQDTLRHLVENSIERTDSNKFLYILNQIDTTAREDNPEEVFGAWQRALAQKGLTAGRFYTIYNEEASVPIEDNALRERFRSKRDHDLAEINARIHQVEIERAYRIIGALERKAHEFGERVVPLLTRGLERWRKTTLTLDAIIFGLILAGLAVGSVQAGYWQGWNFVTPSWLQTLIDKPLYGIGAVALVVAAVIYIHYQLRGFARSRVAKWLSKQAADSLERASLLGALHKSTRPWRSIFFKTPAGWGRRAKRRIAEVIADTDRYVQNLNDRFASPSSQSAPGVSQEGSGGAVTDVEPKKVETPAESPVSGQETVSAVAPESGERSPG